MKNVHEEQNWITDLPQKYLGYQKLTKTEEEFLLEACARDRAFCKKVFYLVEPGSKLLCGEPWEKTILQIWTSSYQKNIDVLQNIFFLAASKEALSQFSLLRDEISLEYIASSAASFSQGRRLSLRLPKYSDQREDALTITLVRHTPTLEKCIKICTCATRGSEASITAIDKCKRMLITAWKEANTHEDRVFVYESVPLFLPSLREELFQILQSNDGTFSRGIYAL